MSTVEITRSGATRRALLLLAKLSLYATELNPVLSRTLWPRALPWGPPTPADDQVLHDLAHDARRRPDQRVGTGFGTDAAEAGEDARRGGDDTPRGAEPPSPRRTPSR